VEVNLKNLVRNLAGLLLLAMVCSLLPACSKGNDPSSQIQANTPALSSVSVGQTTSSSTSSPVSTGVNTVSPGGVPDIADMKLLSSYRLSIKNTLVEGAGSGSVSYMKYEWVKAQKAEHAWMEDGKGTVSEVYISIGDKKWIWMGAAGMGWIEQPQQSNQPNAIPSDLASQLKQAQKDIGNSKARFDRKGTEKVNSINCVRYEVEYNLSTEMPNLQSGGTSKTVMHCTGDVWIADQSGVPSVTIKSITKNQINVGGNATMMEVEQNLTDIGASITISPPEGVQQIPGMSTPPSGMTTKPGANTTTSSKSSTSSTTQTTNQSGNNPVFADSFDGDLNTKWKWIDPNDDSVYDLTSHSGFLHMTVPDGNDLAWAANYDAPRLLVPQKGDFRIETLVEFDPTDSYQGAGLLVWQDENTFLRLEFGYGGMANEGKNIAFLIQEEGSLGLVDSLVLSETTKKVELRIVREGNEYRAGYRIPGGSWKDISSTELKTASTVDVGIVQITQYTSNEKSADFDYFKIYDK
jgi:regulation of enolase protein 1 (concanavalin A-like superfamily)